MALATIVAANQALDREVRGLLKISDYEADMPPAEKSAVSAFIQRMKFSDMLLLPSFKSNFQRLSSPAGYVARHRTDLPFHADAYVDSCLFDGFAYIEVRGPDFTVLDDETRRRFHRCMNITIPSVSPRPPTLHGGGDWIPSLGKGGYACLYGGWWRRGTSKPGDEAECMCIGVSAGLDVKTRAELDIFLYQQASLAKPPTYREMFAADVGLLEPFRALARENRARLLAQMAECLGVRCEGVVERESIAFEKAVLAGEQDKVKEATAWLDMGKCRVPSWFRLEGDIRGLPPLPADLKGFHLGAHLTNPIEVQKHPIAVATAKEVLCNDVIFESDDYLVTYMGCACTMSPVGVPQSAGPSGNLNILNYDSAERNWRMPDKVHAFAHVPRFEFDARVATSDAELPVRRALTWTGVDVNRNLSANYVFSGTVDSSRIKCNDWLQLKPLTGIVSVVDPEGNISAPPTGIARFRALGVDEQ